MSNTENNKEETPINQPLKYERPDYLTSPSKKELKRKERAIKNANKDSENEPINWKKEIFEWFYTIAIALLVVFVIKGFIFDIVKVDGSSMYPTLHDNDRLIVTKLGYKPKQGDIIILDSTYQKREDYKDEYEQAKGSELSFIDNISFNLDLPKRLKPVYYVKRIIALPGQTVDIKNGKVLVDGAELDEPYYDGTTRPLDTEMPVTVDENCVFVMGDNRDHSTDSRASSLGQVPYKAILGKSQIRLFPFSSMGLTK